MELKPLPRAMPSKEYFWNWGSSNVMVMVESTVLEDTETKKVERLCRYFKAKVLVTTRSMKSAIL